MPQRYLAGLNEGRSGAAKYKKKKKKKNLCLIKIKPKEMQGMVVVQIYILAFPIDKKKKSFTRLSSFYLVYVEDSFEMRFLL